METEYIRKQEFSAIRRKRFVSEVAEITLKPVVMGI
jgi:hypothetical protein